MFHLERTNLTIALHEALHMFQHVLEKNSLKEHRSSKHFEPVLWKKNRNEKYLLIPLHFLYHS
jgi:hypothetical protein